MIDMTDITRAIAITAHHDDALLWIGGTILRTRSLGWMWTVIALCVPDNQKKEYFNNYCNAVRVISASFSYFDYQSGNPFSRNLMSDFQNAITQVSQNTRYDWVFTHSRDPDGEYGSHVNHDEVRKATQSLMNNGALCAGSEHLVFFSYAPIFGGNGRATTAKADADFHLQLTYDELLQKCAWCMAAPDAFTNLKNIGFPCPNPESFAGDSVRLPVPFIPRG